MAYLEQNVTNLHHSPAALVNSQLQEEEDQQCVKGQGSQLLQNHTHYTYLAYSTSTVAPQLLRQSVTMAVHMVSHLQERRLPSTPESARTVH